MIVDTSVHWNASGGLWVIVLNVHSSTPVDPSGKGITSLTAHRGPVDFLVAASNTLTSDLLRQDAANVKDEDRGQEVPARRAEKPRGLLLQYRLRSTCQLPGKLLSSQPEPAGPKLHTEPPEDGSIYAVSEDPDVWVRGRAMEWGSEAEARRSRVLSTAIFSGGRGHRRLGGSSAGDEDTTENALLVWQLPLTASQ